MIHFYYPSTHVACRLDLSIIPSEHVSCDRADVTCSLCLAQLAIDLLRCPGCRCLAQRVAAADPRRPLGFSPCPHQSVAHCDHTCDPGRSA